MMTFDEAMKEIRGAHPAGYIRWDRLLLAIGTEVERLRKMLTVGAETGGDVGEGTMVFDGSGRGMVSVEAYDLLMAQREKLVAEVDEFRKAHAEALDEDKLETLSPEQCRAAVRTVFDMLRHMRLERGRKDEEHAAERRRLEAELAAARSTAAGLFDRNVALTAEMSTMRAARDRDAVKMGEARKAQRDAEATLADFKRRLCEALKIGA